MTTPLPDAAVMTLERGVGLFKWAARGTFERESRLVASLAGHLDRLIVVSNEGPDEERHAERLKAIVDNPNFDIVIRPGLRSARDTANDVLDLLGASQRIVVHTDQFDDGGVALAITQNLHRAGRPAALIARGGRLHSKLLSHQTGPHTAEAIEAGIIEESVCRHARLIVGAGREMLDDLCWRLNIDPQRTRVVPNFIIDDEPFAEADQREKDFILSCGPLIARRRLHLVIDAFARYIRENNADAHLEITGDGPLRKELEAQAAEHDADIRFTGVVPYAELLDKMRRCTLNIFAGEGDPTPRSVLESMSAGAAIIAVDWNGGSPIDNGVSGIITPPSAEALSHAIMGLIADPDWREMLGSIAARNARKDCGLERVTNAMLDVYRDALPQPANEATNAA